MFGSPHYLGEATGPATADEMRSDQMVHLHWSFKPQTRTILQLAAWRTEERWHAGRVRVSRYNVQKLLRALEFAFVKIGAAEIEAIVEIDVAVDELGSVDGVAISPEALLALGASPVFCPVRWRY